MKTFRIKLENGTAKLVEASDAAAALQVWYLVMGGSLPEVVSVKRVDDE